MSRLHRGGHYLDQAGTAGIHLLVTTTSDRNQGDTVEKEGTDRGALAELDDLSCALHPRVLAEQSGDLNLEPLTVNTENSWKMATHWGTEKSKALQDLLTGQLRFRS